MRFSLLAVVLSVLMIQGCTNRQLETRVAWSSSCFQDQPAGNARAAFLAPIAIALAPKLIEGAVDSAALALKKAGERAELAHSSNRVISRPYMVTDGADLKISDEHRCLIVSRGHFPAPVTSEEGTIQSLSDIEDRVFTFEATVQHLSGEPYFRLAPYRLRVGNFEGKSLWSPNKRELNIAISMAVPGSSTPFASTLFTFKDIERNADWNPSKQAAMRSISPLLALPPLPESGKKAQAKQEAFIAPYVLAESTLIAKTSTSPPTAAQSPNPLLAAAVVTSTRDLCKKIKTYNSDYPKAPLTDPSCSREITLAKADVDKALLDAQSPDALEFWARAVCPNATGKGDSLKCGESYVPPVKPSARFGYMVVDVSVVEARQGNKFAAFLGEAIGSAKADMTKAIAQQVIPEQKKTLEDSKDAADRAAHRAVILADLAVIQSEQELAELQASGSSSESSVTTARASVIKAKIAANDAYRIADLPLPYPELG